MEGQAFLEELKALTASEQVLEVSKAVNELKVKFEDYTIEQERLLQIAQMEAQEKGETIPDNPELMQLKESFLEEFKSYRVKRKLAVDHKNDFEATNLAAKRAMIVKLKEVIANEENIGAAFGALKEIQEKWKTVGDIPRDKRDEVQAEYSKLIEDFFYNINIYKQLKEHDLHRNSQMKNAVILELEKLDQETNNKELEHKLKALQHDWEDIGPVTNEEWEALKEKYWSLVRKNYDRINAFYEERRAALQKNIELKNELLAKTTEFVSDLPENLDVKGWEQKTTELLAIQEEWKTIGFGPKKENEEVWKGFRAQCDLFFAKKKEFFGEIQEVHNKIADKKQELIQEARQLESSTDWKNTANKLKQLQARWKQLGHSGQRNEQKLWKEFRTSCDAFFNNREAHFKQMDAEFEGNLTAKKELVATIETFILPTDSKEAIAALQKFASDFAAIGRVPMKEKDAIYSQYKKALDQHYAALKLEGTEKEKVMFKAKLDTLAGSADSSRLFSREKQDLRTKIDQLKSDIIQFENNLGFFANSKGADALKQDVLKKIDKAKAEIESIKAKIKMIPNE